MIKHCVHKHIKEFDTHTSSCGQIEKHRGENVCFCRLPQNKETRDKQGVKAHFQEKIKHKKTRLV
jgi:hypothetical protein